MKLLFTGGLGDFITVESFMTDFEKDSVTELFLATRSSHLIEPIIDQYKIFPNLKEKNIFFNEWSKIFSFVDLNHIELLNNQLNLNLDIELLKTCVDYNIINIFPKINNGMPLNGSRILKNKPVSENYGIINPYSPNDRQNGKRDLKINEWDNIIKNIEKLNIPFMVINISDDFIPAHPLLINMNKKTSIIESVEIIKKANWYIGTDSWIPALMSKYLPPERLIIKTVSSHYVQYLNIYLSPITNFGNVHCGLESFKL